MDSETFYDNKTAIVTGASSGIGREIAKELMIKGSNVIAVGRREDKLRSLAAECELFNGKCFPVAVDLTDSFSIQKIMSVASDISAQIDILINNAGLGFSAEISDVPNQKIFDIINTNLISTIYLTRAVLAKMPKERNSSIVFVTSLAGKIGFPNLSVYSASKFGLEGFAESIRHELFESGISVTVLRPGVTDTEFFDQANMQQYASNARKEGEMHSANSVAKYLLDNLPQNPQELTFGRDSLFLKLLPFIPFNLRFKILSLIS